VLVWWADAAPHLKPSHQDQIQPVDSSLLRDAPHLVEETSRLEKRSPAAAAVRSLFVLRPPCEKTSSNLCNKKEVYEFNLFGDDDVRELKTNFVT
jgi:hypothetical protein